MIIEAWERLHGYNNWMPAIATVQASRLESAGFGNSNSAIRAIALQSVCKIVWQDHNRVSHTAEFEVFEESSLYQLCEGDKVDIRFNPAKPDEFYLPGLLQSKLAKTWKLTFYVVLFALVVIAIAVAWFGPAILDAVSH